MSRDRPPAGRGAPSTGPRSGEGKARSSRNATKHGIHARVSAEELAVLAARLQGLQPPDEDPSGQMLSTLVVLDRARVEKMRLLQSLGPEPTTQEIEETLTRVLRVDEYERKARSRVRAALPPIPRRSFA